MSGDISSKPLKITTLGGLSIKIGDEPVVGFASRKVEALLVYLACTQHVQPREVLADLLWDDRPQQRAMSNLRVLLASLRRSLGEYVAITRHTAATREGANIWVDSLQLESAVQEIQAKGGVFWPSEAQSLSDTLALYGGDFLEGFSVWDCRDFEDWVVLEREHYYQLVTTSMKFLVDYYIERGDYQAGIISSRRWVVLDPLSEDAHRKLMRLLAYAGNTADALAQFETCSQILQDELGVGPSIETRQLYGQIQSGDLPTPEPKPIREPATLNQLPAFIDPQAAEIFTSPVFVARQRQLERLNGFMDKALAGEGQVAFVTGGPGRGKTALLGEFARRAMASFPDLLAAEGSCSAYLGIGDSYLPFHEVICMLSGDVEGKWEAGALTLDHARRMWGAAPLTACALMEYGPNLIDTFVPAEELLARAEISMSFDRQKIAQLRKEIFNSRLSQTGIEQNLLFEQFTNILGALSKNRPILLLLDDFQWADNSSIALLFHLARRLAGTRILLAVAYRPDEVSLGRDGKRHPLEKILSEIKIQYGDVWVDLADIEKDEEKRFVNQLLDSEPNRLDQEFREALHRHTGGYALFTVELLHALQERGQLVKNRRGEWGIKGELDWAELPARAEAVIEERIGRLEVELRDTLSVASVEGEDFTAQVVSSIRQVNERDLIRTLAQELEKRHRLVRAQGSITLNQHIISRYCFTHALFQRYLYNELDSAERALLHHQIGEILEELYAGQTDLIAGQLAFHFRGDDQRESQYSIIAGERAFARYANAEALRYFSRALELTPAEDLEGRYILRYKLDEIFELVSDRESQSQNLEEMVNLAASMGDEQKIASTTILQGRLALQTGDFPTTILKAEKGFRLAKSAGDISEQARGHLLLGFAVMRQGRFEDARIHFQRVLTLSRTAGLHKLEADALRFLGFISEHHESLGCFQSALTIYTHLGDKGGELRILNNLGVSYAAQGDFLCAQDYYTNALALSRKIGDRQNQGLIMSNCSNILLSIGKFSKAKEYIDESNLILKEINNPVFIARSIANLGEYYKALGQNRLAEGYYERALQIIQKVGSRDVECSYYVGICLVCVRLGDGEKALGYGLKSLRLAQQNGLNYDQACAWIALGFAYEHQNDCEQSHYAYQKAMCFWEKIGSLPMVAECKAGLARLSFTRGDIYKALAYVNDILYYLENCKPQNENTDNKIDIINHPLISTEDPIRIHLTCYQTLVAVGDSRANDILQMGCSMMCSIAGCIEDELIKHAYLTNISSHVELTAAWEARVE